jgi:phenylacetate-CoA ligase
MNGGRAMRDYPAVQLSLDAWVKGRIGFEGDGLTVEAIREYQQNKLRKTIGLASRNSPFHRRLADRDPAVLSEIPLTTQQDIRSHGLQMLCTSQGDIGRVVTLQTSGTSGAPKRLFFTREDQENTIEFFRAGMATFTAPGERVLILLPGESPGSIGSLLNTALERMGAIPVPHGIVRSLPETHEEMIASEADILVGVPSHVLALARYSEWAKQAERISVRRVLLSTDRISDMIVP